MAQSTGATSSNTSAPTRPTRDDLAAAQSALTAAGQQYAASNGLSYDDRQDLLDEVRTAAAQADRAEQAQR